VKARRRYSDRLTSVAEPVFPGYLFCRFALSSKWIVLASNAVEGVVGFGSRPAPLEASEIEAIRRAVDAGAAAAPLPTIGDRVRVIAGSLRDVKGVLVRELNKTRFLLFQSRYFRGPLH
jgi:transcriptional antiterminator NusG